MGKGTGPSGKEPKTSRTLEGSMKNALGWIRESATFFSAEVTEGGIKELLDSINVTQSELEKGMKKLDESDTLYKECYKLIEELRELSELYELILEKCQIKSSIFNDKVCSHIIVDTSSYPTQPCPFGFIDVLNTLSREQVYRSEKYNTVFQIVENEVGFVKTLEFQAFCKTQRDKVENLKKLNEEFEKPPASIEEFEFRKEEISTHLTGLKGHAQYLLSMQASPFSRDKRFYGEYGAPVLNKLKELNIDEIVGIVLSYKLPEPEANPKSALLPPMTPMSSRFFGSHYTTAPSRPFDAAEPVRDAAEPVLDAPVSANEIPDSWLRAMLRPNS